MSTGEDPAQQPIGKHMRTGPLKAGQRVQLTDYKGRKSTITLVEGGQWHTHQGVLDHHRLIGQPEGIVVENSGGYRYQVLRPLLNDYVLSMPRGATVVYPKDSAQIVQVADIFPGAHVLEAGVGSGALSISLLRAVGDAGTLNSYELREEFAEIARGNVEAFFGQPHPGWNIHLGDAAQKPLEIETPGGVDRVVLDMLAPWECLEAVRTVLAPGGVWVSYVASVTQLSRLTEAIRGSGGFTEPEAHETMLRTWHLDGLAVRPDHRMVAHTGFLLSARRLADDQLPLELKKREKVSEPSPEDKQAWPGTAEDAAQLTWDEEGLKTRTVSGKKARRAAATALKHAQAAEEVTPGE
ncbi:tRNA (adenine-N1)-methyltransferase [Nesterenkonia alkaliphila]|uniref:tRNA (Adenine-N1)-methyltransferase n=1 Tax=Nesterenkonia alkaliphila TaxID=1463631 RepID=A0A7K1UM72_9MICC|nr:tRNA (adenine-N1)-methyltransferase [Nesterenkonia alkaliphila]MVT27585.1 tRNA (adenine-N1)-methyltransferase [Nesterenkonia alkaliphila]GFZ79870.1 SAM-dependent methyltransferase [Nesterenkonia alkaliphila]